MERARWSHGFFLWFFKRVCLYAYGYGLSARHRLMHDVFSFSEDTWPCSACKNPWHMQRSTCGFCGLGDTRRSAAAAAAESAEQLPFFVLIARYAMLLRLPEKWFALMIMFEQKEAPANTHVKCNGCITFALRSDSTRRCGKRNAHEESNVVYCGQAFCRKETYGWLRCEMCRDVFCGQCVGICTVCNNTGSCTDCARKYQCEDVDEVEDSEGCGKRCVWHAERRTPYQHERTVALYCAKHLALYQSLDQIKLRCTACATAGFLPQCDTAGCWNRACVHTGDEKCDTCKRIKLSE